MASPELPFGEIMPCSPTLVLSSDKSQNLEAHSFVKPSVERPTEEIEVASRAVSSIMSKRLFERDLAEGRGLESKILATGERLVALQSLGSLRGDVQPTRLELKLRSPEQSTEFEKERQRKGKGKLVESRSKGDKTSDTECDDVVAYVAKNRKEGKDERVKKNKNLKGGKEITCEEGESEKQGHWTTVKNVKILLDEETLGIILSEPMEGIRSIKGHQPSSGFSKQATKCGDIKREGLRKKLLKGEY
ncbi:hypothetical protein H5410_050994 [Solanum commersonii]|uniref:Uncharacterized protein n=1 Tax=Solanum commersonii TaxID=4109 RepID=A0A9J5WYC2_SOLCO|nr:hypothetical protein H5410_050994 [Solanum commersonii]